MFLSYNGFSHGLGECAISITKETRRAEDDTALSVTERWDVQGLYTSQSASVAVIEDRLRSMEDAYSEDGHDATIFLPDGSQSHYFLESKAAIGGVRVMTRPEYPTGTGAEGVTYRTFHVVLEAEFPIDTSATVAFFETVNFAGGGPRFGMLETLAGMPIKQKLRRATIFRASQEGEAIGFGGYPSIPRPIWPAAQVETPVVRYRNPRRRRGFYLEYPVSWSYQFESAYQLIGRPNKWG